MTLTVLVDILMDGSIINDSDNNKSETYTDHNNEN